MAEIEFTIERVGFESIKLDTDGGGPYGMQSDTLGFGVPPVVPHFIEGAGEGGTFLGDRVGMRPLDIKVIFIADGRLAQGELVRSLANLVRSRPGKPQPRLVATFNSGEAFELPFTYVSGLEGDGSDMQPSSTTATLSLMAFKPYWVSRTPMQFIVQADASSVDLLSDLAGLPLGSSTAFGMITLDNPGDVEAPVDWRIVGPGGPVTISVGGRGFVLDTVLTAGEVRTVDGTTKRVRDGDGVDRYEELADAPFFPMLPDGPTTVQVQMDGATPASSIAGSVKPRREVIY